MIVFGTIAAVVVFMGIRQQGLLNYFLHHK